MCSVSVLYTMGNLLLYYADIVKKNRGCCKTEMDAFSFYYRNEQMDVILHRHCWHW